MFSYGQSYLMGYVGQWLIADVRQQLFIHIIRLPIRFHQIGKRLVTIPYIGLVNILAEKELVPEILQERVTADNIAQEALAILENPARQRVMKQNFQALRNSLGSPGASHRAAKMILTEIRQ